jgi:hypothetical protein
MTSTGSVAMAIREAHRCLRCGNVEEWTVGDGD